MIGLGTGKDLTQVNFPHPVVVGQSQWPPPDKTWIGAHACTQIAAGAELGWLGRPKEEPQLSRSLERREKLA